MIQGPYGTPHNLEVVAPHPDGGLAHIWREDARDFAWHPFWVFDRSARYVGASLIHSSYGDNFEVVAVTEAGDLVHLWRDGTTFRWSAPVRIASGVQGVPSLIQGPYGSPGNLEVVVPRRGGGLLHLWRDDAHAFAWKAPTRFGGTAGYVGASLIHSSYGTNFEVVATTTDGALVHLWRDGRTFAWSGPTRIATGVQGSPSLIQGPYGTPRNLEVVVPRRGGGLVHHWRDDAHGFRWSGATPFGGSVDYRGASLIHSSYGNNFEVIATDSAHNVDHFWRNGVTFAWSGRGHVAFDATRSVSFRVSECVFGWTAAYQQTGTRIVARIRLNPAAGITTATMDTLRQRWRDGILATWSNRFDCGGSGSRKRIVFDIEWVTTGQHHTVEVVAGPGRSNMGTWHTTDAAGVAAHEFGHMIGHPDEYAEPAVCPARTPVGTGTIMETTTAPAVARFYTRIASAHGVGHTPAAAAAPPAPPAPPAPEEDSVHWQSMERLTPRARAQVLDRLQGLADGAAVAEGDAGTALVSLTIAGGAPGSRYLYEVAVAEDGTVTRDVLDELDETPRTTDSVTIARGDAATVFAAAAASGLLRDEPPSLAPVDGSDILPDSLVAVITVRDGDVLRRVVVPAVEPGAAGEGVDIPIATTMLLSRPAAEQFAPLLDALATVERTVG